MMFSKLTSRARRVLELAANEARDCGRDSILPEHLLVGLLKEGTGTGVNILINVCKRDLSAVTKSAFDLLTSQKSNRTNSNPELDQSSVAVLTNAAVEAKRLGQNWLGTEHLLLALVACPDENVARIFQKLRVKSGEVREMLDVLIGLTPPIPNRDSVAESLQHCIECLWDALPAHEKTFSHLEFAMTELIKRELETFKKFIS